MKYHKFIDKIFGSRVKIDLLRSLYRLGNKKWTIRELAKFNDKDHSAINYAIKELEEMNIIYLERHGKSTLITLNNNSILTKLLQVFDFEDNTLNELIKDIKKIVNKKVISCILFGSIARKEENPDSDVDLLIIAKSKKPIQNLIYDKQKYFIEKYGNILQVQIYTKKQFNKNLPFVKTIEKDYILIAGEDILK
ncbi:MAG: nucleotidyltransferase domain-containing protein [Nanoarchaeota archaeon]